MNIKFLPGKITSKVGRQVLIAQKNSPVILFGAGAIGFVATVVLASSATLKMSEILHEAEKKNLEIEHAREIAEKTGQEYTEEDVKKDSLTVKVQTAIKIAKLYAPAIAVGAISIGCLTGSHVIMNRRNVGLTAAYAALDKGFKEYRARVTDEYGKDKDQEFRYGMIEREMAVETDEGTSVKTVKVINPNSKNSIYSRPFDEWNKNWQSTTSYNQMFLQCQQNYANDLLRSRGHVFLNDVYDMLGIERSKEGAVVGWLRDRGDEGDGYIDFGVYNDTFGGSMFVNGLEKCILLDFNVDGVIYDKI